MNSATTYTCPICGAINELNSGEIHREGNPCQDCGCNTRFRATIISLLVGLHLERPRGPELRQVAPQMTINGIGISDAEAYAKYLKKSFNYLNTFFHKEPFLDIEDSESYHKYKPLDFIICSDVIEHTLLPPPAVIFRLYQSLKPGGLLVLVAPTYLIPEHIERYPSLACFETVQDGDSFKIRYTTKHGVTGEDPNPVFHGGPGRVLELRILSHSSLLRDLESAGFKVTTIEDESLLKQYGSWWPAWSERSEFEAKAIGRPFICKKPPVA